MFRINHARPDPTGQSGITIHQPDKCWPGYTLFYSRQSEHAQLVDMTGQVVHHWEYAAHDEIHWHFCEMLPNGHLLVIPNNRNGQMLLELDWNSQPVWKHPARAHHDAQRLANGNTLCVCHGQAHYRELDARPLLYDYLQEITPDHQVAWEWHYGSHHQQICDLLGLNTPILNSFRDWPHINTVEALPDTPLGQRDARFRAGNVLISGRGAHTIAVIDKESGDVTWAWGPGVILGQHQPTMLAHGNILLFDNGNGPPFRGDSRVLEIDPPTGRIVWEYASEPRTAFWTPVGSGNQRLPNGNTLICAMNWEQTGRIFEVTPEGEIVWEFWNPEGLPTYRATRYAPEVVEPLLRHK